MTGGALVEKIILQYYTLNTAVLPSDCSWFSPAQAGGLEVKVHIDEL